MKFVEGCYIAPINIYSVNREDLQLYTKNIFKLAHYTQIQIALEPSIVVTKYGFKKISIAVEPGSVVICDKSYCDYFRKCIEIYEDVWIETLLLIPYTVEPLCGLANEMGLPVDVDEAIGVYHMCRAVDDVDEEVLEKTLAGGLLEIVGSYVDRDDGILRIEPVRNRVFMFFKGLGLETLLKLSLSRYTEFSIPKKFEVYSENIAFINSTLVLTTFGDGYISLFKSVEPYTVHIYIPLLLSVYGKPLNSPRASLYARRLSESRKQIM